MTLSYGITACTEHEELNRLLGFLLKYRNPEDEIIVQTDYDNTSKMVKVVIEELLIDEENTGWVAFPLNKDFAAFKNNLNDRCTGEYILQLDADEIPSVNLVNNIHWILENNPHIDVFLVPRENKVIGITESHIQKWGWNLDEFGRINYPDFQHRLYRNNEIIEWINRVHEVLTNYSTISRISPNEGYDIIHIKDINRQEQQNEFYSTI